MSSKRPIEDYFDLRSRIDEMSSELHTRYGSDIVCKAGCTGCCINLTVFPVEFFAIVAELEKAGYGARDVVFDNGAPCGFLDHGRCRIYPFRPVICRTHGLPILFLDDQGEEPTWEVSFCSRNFTGKNEIEFSEDGLLDIESINGELNRINGAFIASLPERGYGWDTRIPLKDLCGHLTGGIHDTIF